MRGLRRKLRAGFTMVEVIATVTIIGLISVIAVPTMIGFIQHGQQVNRMNVARTLYLAAQNQLTEKRITRSLEEYVNGLGAALDNIPPEQLALIDDPGNTDYLYYISKPEGFDISHPVYQLLDPVIMDKKILESAILIEFNIRTGAVLSAFYGDMSTDFMYNDHPDSANDRNNVYGGRGTDAYEETARTRRQGYYGVEETGSYEEHFPMRINIYDSYNKRFSEAPELEDILYAEIYIRDELLTGKYRLSINGDMYGPVIDIDDYLSANGIYAALGNSALFSSTYNGIYRDIGYTDPEFARFIWVLDYVGGDMSGSPIQQSIQRYASTFDSLQNLRVGIANGGYAESFTEAHPYFLTEHYTNYTGGDHKIASARHLYNIRYKQDGKFTQVNNIDLTPVTNFPPIDSLSGSYEGAGFSIDNLIINIPSENNVGLFGTVNGTITNITLNDPSVTGVTNVGALCGTTSGNIEDITINSPHVTGTGDNIGGLSGTASGNIKNITINNPSVTGVNYVGGFSGTLSGTADGIFVRFNDNDLLIKGNSSVGGIAGQNGGALMNITFVSAASTPQVVGTNNVGGIVGNNAGMLSHTMFLALAPEDTDFIYPIIGNGTISDASLYYLRGAKALRPGEVNGEVADPDTELLPYNMREPEEVYGGDAVIGRTTLGMLKHDDGVITGGWNKDTSFYDPDDETDMRDKILDLSNEFYPYPYPPELDAEWTSFYWPLVDGDDESEDEEPKIPLATLAYYEIYEGGERRLWTDDDDDNLRYDVGTKITEAGYLVMLDLSDATSTSLDDISFSFKNQSIDIAWKDTAWTDMGSDIWVRTFALSAPSTSVSKGLVEAFKSAQTNSLVPLVMEMKIDGESTPLPLNELINPLFAKGLYREDDLPVNEFYIRTQWQMSNISAMTDPFRFGVTPASNATLYKTFIQELNIDFMNSGIGVNGDNTGYIPIDTAIVTGDFLGEYDGKENNISNLSLTNTGNGIGLFADNGTSGKIHNFTLNNATVTGGVGTGGVAATNNGTIENLTLRNVKVTGGDNTGGVAGTNDGISTGLELYDVTVSGGVGVGGVAGVNNSSITNSLLTRVKASANNNVGGVAGSNNSGGVISNTLVYETEISNSNNSIGGIAGYNSGDISNTGVAYSTLRSVAGGYAVGGIAGVNHSTVNNVFFLSTNAVNDVPVSGGNNVGGIIGNNNGSVSNTFYIAPAPSTIDISGANPVITIYPIVGGGTDAGVHNYYLSGNRHDAIVREKETPVWINENYNRGTLSGGGESKQSGFLYLDWLNNNALTPTLSDWEQVYITSADYRPTNGYVYPLPSALFCDGDGRLIEERFKLIDKWPIADNGNRDGQKDRDTTVWADYTGEPWAVPDNDKIPAAVNFVNGDFSAALAGGPPPRAGHMGDNWHSMDMKFVPGWYTRPISINYAENNNYYALPQWDGNRSNYGWKGGHERYYYPHNYGQDNAPAAPGGIGNVEEPTFPYVTRWSLIELQDPGSDTHGFMRTNYKGEFNRTQNVLSSEYRYAELNGEIQGTLYQVCYPAPGAEFIYSFHHATNGVVGGQLNVDGWYNNPRNADRMNFYLTPFDGNTQTIMVDKRVDAALRDAKMRSYLIRPCQSPRTRAEIPAGTNADPRDTRWNPSAWNTVNYGASNGTTNGYDTSYDLSYHRGKSYTQLNGLRREQPIPTGTVLYLYDVWIGSVPLNGQNSVASGYGITFWSTDNYIIPSNIPLNGVNNIALLPPEAQTNVIGYWDVSYGWKHYYGEYTVDSIEGVVVPLEFAFQSVPTESGRDAVGNYLDGLKFQSPSHLTVEETIKDINGNEIKYVQPGDKLKVELVIRNWGEKEAWDIVIKDQLSPFEDYIKFDLDPTVFTVKKDGAPISGYTPPTDLVKDSHNNDVLVISLPGDLRLVNGEVITVEFGIEVLDDTLNFYFKNQAAVEWKEKEYAAYANVLKKNYSQVRQIDINNIELHKTVTHPNPPINYNNAPFTVDLTIKALADGIETFNGIITDVIPRGFYAYDFALPTGASVSTAPAADGSTRVIIRGINLDPAIKEVSITYKLSFIGNGYGVAYISDAAEYRFSYLSDDYLLLFPTPKVYLRLPTRADVYFAVSGVKKETHGFRINEWLGSLVKYTAEHFETPAAVLTDPDAIKQTDNNWVINRTDEFDVLLRPDGNFEFTPYKSGTFQFHCKIPLEIDGHDLSSNEIRITVYVAIEEEVVYYEKYSDDTYGYYASDSKTTLSDTKIIEESGYGVLSGSDNSNLFGADPIRVDHVWLYVFNNNTAVSTTELQPVIPVTNDAIILGHYHPNFAKAVYDSSGNIINGTAAIRTPQQMRNIGVLNDNLNITFKQERDLDFRTASPTTLTESVVVGEFRGTFDGNGKKITNVQIASPGSIAPIGLFEINSGTISRIMLTGDAASPTSIHGGNNVGGIAGINRGHIEYCTVRGDSSGLGMHIKGDNNVGGIQGLLDGGTDLNNIVENTTNTIEGIDYVGGIAGYNSNGAITNPTVKNVSIIGISNVGIFVGGGTAATGDSENVKVIEDGIVQPTLEELARQAELEQLITELEEELTLLINEALTEFYGVEPDIYGAWHELQNALIDAETVLVGGTPNAITPFAFSTFGFAEVEVERETQLQNAIDRLRGAMTNMRYAMQFPAETNDDARYEIVVDAPDGVYITRQADSGGYEPLNGYRAAAGEEIRVIVNVERGNDVVVTVGNIFGEILRDENLSLMMYEVQGGFSIEFMLTMPSEPIRIVVYDALTVEEDGKTDEDDDNNVDDDDNSDDSDDGDDDDSASGDSGGSDGGDDPPDDLSGDGNNGDQGHDDLTNGDGQTQESSTGWLNDLASALLAILGFPLLLIQRLKS